MVISELEELLTKKKATRPPTPDHSEGEEISLDEEVRIRTYFLSSYKFAFQEYLEFTRPSSPDFPPPKRIRPGSPLTEDYVERVLAEEPTKLVEELHSCGSTGCPRAPTRLTVILR